MDAAEVVQTGPYAHAPDRIDEIRFASTGDLERSFTILIATHAVDDPENPERAGIAILDNDNSRVVFDGLTAPGGVTSPALLFRFAGFFSLSWAEFSAACRSNPRYRGGIPDIDEECEAPRAGNLARQAALGLAVSPETDARSAFVRDLSADPDVPYVFPPVTRDRMTEEICRHLMFVEANGLKSHIGWDIRMNMNWNRTGRIKGLAPMDPEQDFNWRHTVEHEPEIVEIAAKRALSPYLAKPTFILEMTEFPCEFEQAGRHGGFLILKTFCRHHMSATRDVSLSDRLLRLNDEEIEALWVVCRVLDHDLDRASRTRDMEYEMHRLRLDYEKGVELLPA